MLCHGEGLLSPLTALLVLALALSRSPALACLLPAGLYLALQLLALEPAAPQSAQRVLRPRGAAARIAHRGGAHDAPENTLAAIRQVSTGPGALPADPPLQQRAALAGITRAVLPELLGAGWAVGPSSQRELQIRLLWELL